MKMNKKGEGYIDVCVGIVVFVMVLITALNLFSFIRLRVELDQVCDELLETASYEGCFTIPFYDRADDLRAIYGDFDVSFGADRYFNRNLSRVQLGDPMWVKVSAETSVQGLGMIRIPVTVSVKRTGLSEKYWK